MQVYYVTAMQLLLVCPNVFMLPVQKGFVCRALPEGVLKTQPVHPVPSGSAEPVIPSYLAFFMKVLIKPIHLYKALLCLLNNPLHP